MNLVQRFPRSEFLQPVPMNACFRTQGFLDLKGKHSRAAGTKRLPTNTPLLMLVPTYHNIHTYIIRLRVADKNLSSQWRKWKIADADKAALKYLKAQQSNLYSSSDDSRLRSCWILNIVWIRIASRLYCFIVDEDIKDGLVRFRGHPVPKRACALFMYFILETSST